MGWSMPKLVHEKSDNDDKVKMSEFISIKKEESEQDDNHSFIKLIKKEKDDLGDVFTEDKPSTFSILKVEPECNSFEFKHFSKNTNIQDISDSSAMDLNRSNYSPVKPTQSDVKVENATMNYKIYKSHEITFDKWNIKNEEIDIKTEDLEQYQNSMMVTYFGDETLDDQLNKNENVCEDQKTQDGSIKKRLTHQIKPGKLFKCCHCDYQTLYKSHIKRHIPRHKNPEDIQMFECNQCNYQTRYKCGLKKHVFQHKNPEDVKMFKCDQCDYQTINNSFFKRHALKHKNPDGVEMFNCDQCDYQTRYKHGLKKHVLQHNNPHVKMFKCDQCDFQTLHKHGLKNHALRHKNPEDVEMFKCDHCDYQTIEKRYLNRHVLRHKSPHDVHIFKCNQCDYQTCYKGVFKKHASRHFNPDSVKKFNQCDSQTSYKHCLKNHTWQHKNSKVVEIFKCSDGFPPGAFDGSLITSGLNFIAPRANLTFLYLN